MRFQYGHHKKAVERYLEKIRKREGALAVIVSGSLAKESERANSDIDVYVVIEDLVYQEIEQKHAFCSCDHDICDYEGGYIDAKFISLTFLRKAAIYGSEPTRASFLGSEVIYAKEPEIEKIVKQIPVFPEEGWEERCRSFYAQTRVWGNYMYPDAVKKDNIFLKTRAVNEITLFAARYVLCLNKLLFPGYKSLFKMARRCQKTPKHFVAHSEELLREHDLNKVKQYMQMMKSFATVGKVDFCAEGAVSIFIKDSEWNWLDGKPSIEDW